MYTAIINPGATAPAVIDRPDEGASFAYSSPCDLSVSSISLDSPLFDSPVARSRLVSSSDDAIIATTELHPLDDKSKKALKEYMSQEAASLYGYIEKVQQGGITASDRAEILFWLSQLVIFHECEWDTFALAASLFDQLLSKTKLKAKHLKVAAVASFLLAAKATLDECDQPLLADLVANGEGHYTANDLKRMEIVLLDKLGWTLPSKSPAAALHDLIAVAAAHLTIPTELIPEIIVILTPKFAKCALSYELLRYQTSTQSAALLALELEAMTGKPCGELHSVSLPWHVLIAHRLHLRPACRLLLHRLRPARRLLFFLTPPPSCDRVSLQLTCHFIYPIADSLNTHR